MKPLRKIYVFLVRNGLLPKIGDNQHTDEEPNQPFYFRPEDA